MNVRVPAPRKGHSGHEPRAKHRSAADIEIMQALGTSHKGRKYLARMLHKAKLAKSQAHDNAHTRNFENKREKCLTRLKQSGRIGDSTRQGTLYILKGGNM